MKMKSKAAADDHMAIVTQVAGMHPSCAHSVLQAETRETPTTPNGFPTQLVCRAGAPPVKFVRTRDRLRRVHITMNQPASERASGPIRVSVHPADAEYHTPPPYTYQASHYYYHTAEKKAK